jgi:hypothetical protein
MSVGAFISHHAHGPDRRQHRERLPDLPQQVRALHLFQNDRVGGTQHLESLERDVTDDADGQSRTGERLAPDDLFGKT